MQQRDVFCSKEPLRHPICTPFYFDLRSIPIHSESNLLFLIDAFHHQLTKGDISNLAQYFVNSRPLRQIQHWIVSNEVKEPLVRKVIDFLNDSLSLITRSKLIRSSDFRHLKNILQELYSLFQHSPSPQFKSQYLSSVFSAYFLSPLDFHLYALVSICQDNLSFIQPYYVLMGRLFSSVQISDDLSTLLLNGFCKRLSIYLDGKSQQGKQDISNCFTTIIKWAEDDSSKMRRIIDNKLLLNQLLLFQYKSNHLIGAVARAQIPQCYKFQCILEEVIKVVLRSYGSMMGRLDWLELLSEGSGFPKWFVLREAARPLSFLQTYTMETAGVRFALQMIVVCVNDYPAMMQQVDAFIRATELWTEIKFYFGDTQIQQLVKLYAEIMEVPQLYEDIVNNVDNAKIINSL